MDGVCPENLSEALEKLKLASADGAAASADGCLDSLLKALGNNSEYGQNLNTTVLLRGRNVPPAGRKFLLASVK